MGCVYIKKSNNKIATMPSINSADIIISTSSIRYIYDFDTILGRGSFGIFKSAKYKHNPE